MELIRTIVLKMHVIQSEIRAGTARRSIQKLRLESKTTKADGI